jgi:alanine racemase
VIESLNMVLVSRSALIHNFNLCREQVPDAAIMAMVKADAYGHGMVECARVFADCGAASLGVAEVVEGVQLRKAGIPQPIFILAGLLPDFFDALFEYDLTPVLVDGELVTPLAEKAILQKKRIDVHLKVDAGMGRQGCLLPDVAEIVSKITGKEYLHLAGIMAHFPMADDPDSGNSEQILAEFLTMTAELGLDTKADCSLHIANSGGIFSVAGAGLDMIRPGIALYGYRADRTGGETAVGQLQPAMSFISQVIQVRAVPVGTGLGYGHIFTTKKATRLAVLPVGYEDGYLRALSNKAEALLHGRRAPVVGRISMNLTLVDVTEIDNVKPGDEVVLLGRQGSENINADEMADWMETISYEVLCLLGHCNRIVYTD